MSDSPSSTEPPAAAPAADAAATPEVAPSSTTEVAAPVDVVAVVDAVPVVTTPEIEEPAEELQWRYWPNVAWQKALVVVTWAAFGSYWLATSLMRFAPMFDRWSCDGDQPQAVWQYWRYHVDGAFPPGDLITDYAFVMHAPPVWWALMASLSSIVTPLVAAKLLNVVAYVGGYAMLYFATTSRSNHFVGIAATFLMARAMTFYALICGGYARSFGPFLVLFFLWMFLSRRHVLALVALVFSAALYPSVVIPCGIAYGMYVVLAGPTMKERLRRVAGMTAAGLAIIAFGEYQDILAPKWWGPVVTMAEAKTMPAWGRDGRVPEVPLKPILAELPNHAVRGFAKTGHLLSPWLNDHFMKIGGYGLPLVALFVVIGVLWWQKKRRDPFPFEVALLALSALIAYGLARVLFFKLYIPYRSLQHVIPQLFYIAFPLVLYCIFRNTLRTRIAASLATLAVAVVPTVILCGDGFQPNGNYWTNVNDADLFMFLRSLPIDKQIAGQFYIIDREPLFAYHRAYITRNLAHPFRKGYYAEAERRVRVVYSALYSADAATFVKTMNEEHIDYFIYSKNAFKESDRRVFQPVKRDIEKLFKQNRAKGFALEHLPPDVFAYTHGDDLVLDVQKLAGALDRLPPAGDAPQLTPPAASATEHDDDERERTEAP